MLRAVHGFIILALIALAGCTASLVSGYDEQIDSGLSQLNTDLTAFVAKMNNAAGTPAGTYAANTDFYITQEAKIDTWVVRARAHRALGHCPAASLATGSLSQTEFGIAVQKAMAGVAPDDCSVQLLQQLKGAFVDLQNFHQLNGITGLTAAADPRFMTGGVGSLIRSAITLEIAKKDNQPSGGRGAS